MAGGADRAALLEYTDAVLAAQGGVRRWRATVADVVNVPRARLAVLRAAAETVDARTTVADVEADHPQGLIEADEGEDAVAPPDRQGSPSAHDDDDTDAGDVVEVGEGSIDLGVPEGDGSLLFIAPEDEDPAEELGNVSLPAAQGGGYLLTKTVGEAGCGPRASDDADPTGRTGVFRTALGESVEVHLNHRVAHAVVRVRKAHLHCVAADPSTGESRLTLVQGTRTPQAHPDHMTDIVDLAHDNGEDLLRLVNAVRDGTLPQVPARYRFLAEDVKHLLKVLRVCLVVGCSKFATTTSYKSTHLCDDHRSTDVQVTATGEVMRYCKACRAHWPLREFEKFRAVGLYTSMCGACLEKRRSRDGKARAGRGVVPAPAGATGGPVSPSHAGADGGSRIEDRRPECPDAEREAGRDADGAYADDRRAAAARVCLTRGCPGSHMVRPYVVHATHSPLRVHNRCVRQGCPEALEGTRRGTPSLCTRCFKVCSL